MGSTQERIKQRRQYLTKIGWAYTKISLYAVLAFPITFLVLVVLFLLSLDIIFGFNRHSFVSIATILVQCYGLWFLSRKCVRSIKKTRQEAEQLPYVPPVTANTLPAEEILLRGSEEPTQEQSKVLLRGTQNGQDAAAEELLRSSQRQE